MSLIWWHPDHTVWFPQAAGVERVAPPAERGAKGPAAAEQQAAAAERADLPALWTGNNCESVICCIAVVWCFFFFFFCIGPTRRKWAEHDISLTEEIQWSKLSLSLSFYCKAKWHHKISFTINLFLPPKQQTYEPIYVNLMMILDHILNTCCYLVRLMLVSVVSVRAG